MMKMMTMSFLLVIIHILTISLEGGINAISKHVILPDSQFKTIWNFLLLGLILEQQFSIPFIVSFDADINSYYLAFHTLIDLIFLIDIIIHFNCGYYHQGVIILNRKAISLNYLKSW